MKKDWKDRDDAADHSFSGIERGESSGMEHVPEVPGNNARKGTSRRDFLKVLGYSFASAAILASCKRPIINALPYVVQPPELTPGKALYYASTFYDGHEYAGILVKTRDGRPIKIEGNELCSFNREGTTARVQASVLSLYDDARLKSPSKDGTVIKWDIADNEIITALEGINASGRPIVLLSPSINSPTTRKLISEFGSRFRNFRWVQYDPVSYSAIIEANRLSYGRAFIPDYHFENARLVVSINADFLGTWLAPVHFIPGYTSARKPDGDNSEMLRHIHFESGMSLTGANADKRIRIKPSEEKALLTDLYNRIAEKTGGVKVQASQFRYDLGMIAGNLLAAKGKSIVVSGTNDTGIQIIVNGINYLLGNYPGCIDPYSCLNISFGVDTEMDDLAEDLDKGNIGALLIHNVNPFYDYPSAEKFINGIKKTTLSVNMSPALNETTGMCRYECPVSHYLESWDDSEILPGQLSLRQPCINPVFDTRSLQDSLLRWSGNNITFHDYLKNNWERSYFKYSNHDKFQKFWNDSLRNGVFTYPFRYNEDLALNSEHLLNSLAPDGELPKGEFEVILAESVSLGTGTYSNNPWLMELPDPVSRQSWENVAAISPGDAEKLGFEMGSVINIDDNLKLPVFIQPGQADGTISVALGYGHTHSGPVCDNVGKNLYPFIRTVRGNRLYNFYTAIPVATGKVVKLALSQEHNTMEGRAIARDTVLSEYRKDPSAGNDFKKELEESNVSLYPDTTYDGYHWGVSIDLNACVGCNACVIACQAENNIPVVGKSEVTKRRIMHWIRIDRYYSDEPEDPRVYFQPLACQHCDDAPCENVCPVSATNHSSEGLNQMTYNRCVGTKYCINNCPYKVRRFNWFRYTENKVFNYNAASDLGRMVFNPDVTVRERGVVEKCSLCVQRIQEKKLQAQLEKRTIADYEIKTACMQACPAEAIVFGNLNDKNSRVSVLQADPRRYNLLEELHTLPSVVYLTRVRNDEDIST